MARDDDRKRGGRPPGGRTGRGGPPRGKRFADRDKGTSDDRPREPRKVGGRAYRKAHSEAGRDERASGKRFGGGKPGERRFGDKRPYGSRPGAGFRKDGERPRRAFDRNDDRPREKRGDRPNFDRSREDRPARSAEGDRGQRRFDRPKFDSSRGDRPFRSSRSNDRSDRDSARRDRSDDKRPRDTERSSDRPRFSRDRGEHAANDRPRDARRRDDRTARSSHAWRDHPRSETGSPPPDRRGERRGNGQEPRREFQQRPAFGGRGAYRERKPFSSRDSRDRREAPPPPPKKSGERIAKLMARAGLCSRREAEEWIRQGRVAVNGRVIDSPALDIVERDIVAVDGVPLPQRERTRMFLYHKPRGLVTTHSDPEGRPTIFDNLPKNLPRLISIGRLDYNTEGLLLLTNDGGLKRVLELPDTGWLRRYRVRAHGAITQTRLDGLRDGIEVDGVKYGPIEATLDSEPGANVWLTFAIREGKNREVRNVLAALGLEVNRLIRVSYGPFQLGDLGEGEVAEVRGRMLRDQLGERIAKQAGADFNLPVRDYDEGEEEQARLPPREDQRREPRGSDAGAEPEARGKKPKPRGRAGLIADSKGRRVLVQRVGSEDRDRQPTRPRRPPGRYKGKRQRETRDE